MGIVVLNDIYQWLATLIQNRHLNRVVLVVLTDKTVNLDRFVVLAKTKFKTTDGSTKVTGFCYHSTR